jgi:hypothetical protein
VIVIELPSLSAQLFPLDLIISSGKNILGAVEMKAVLLSLMSPEKVIPDYVREVHQYSMRHPSRVCLSS